MAYVGLYENEMADKQNHILKLYKYFHSNVLLVQVSESYNAIALLLKITKGPQGLTCPSDGRIAINSTCCFTKKALRRYLRFETGIFAQELAIEV